MFAEIILARVSSALDRIYHYSIPENLREEIRVGQQVILPFGRSRATGYVVGFAEKAEVEIVRDILEISSPLPLFSEEGVKLARWLAEYYQSFLISALRLVMPPGQKIPNPKPQFPNNSKIQNSNFQIPLRLTKEQETALEQINEAVENQRPETFLLHGVTGSGKTEVYLRAIAHALSRGKTAVCLVPEIGLTPQLIKRFRERFADHIALLHSGLTLKQRREEWGRIAAGEADIVLGTRSAIFSPLGNLGLIVLDEEYEVTYKSDKSPRYHTRAVALKLAAINNAVVVLGSATPSIETYHQAETGVYRKLILPRRIDDRPLPPVELIDMRAELKRKNFGVLSARLQAGIKDALSKREQIILFMNRLGYFTFVICRECGLTIECPNCSVSLVYHDGGQQLRCGRCGYASEAPLICPRCQSASIKYFGAGTQKIEAEVARIFPAARIIRWDRDAVSKRGAHEAFFSTFAGGKADVLIGTQMVTKGLDVANVTLVGVVSADTALNLPDFRAAEHTFQQLTQVAGRAGRSHLPGKVVIQTYNPEHYAIKFAAGHDYESFYRQEIEHRRELNYPPFSGLIGIIISAREQDTALKIADDLKAFLRKRTAVEILGPAPAPIRRLRGEWRYRLLLKGGDETPQISVAESLRKMVIPRGVKVAIDVDPVSML